MPDSGPAGRSRVVKSRWFCPRRCVTDGLIHQARHTETPAAVLSSLLTLAVVLLPTAGWTRSLPANASVILLPEYMRIHVLRDSEQQGDQEMQGCVFSEIPLLPAQKANEDIGSAWLVPKLLKAKTGLENKGKVIKQFIENVRWFQLGSSRLPQQADSSVMKPGGQF